MTRRSRYDWMLKVPCHFCQREVDQRCVRPDGQPTATHSDRRDLAREKGYDSAKQVTPTTAAYEAVIKRIKIDEVEVMALADKLKFAHRMAGDPFYAYMARTFIELGFKP